MDQAQTMIHNEKSLYEKSSTQVIKDRFVYGLIGLATSITVGILIFIIGFIFYKGIPHIDLHFLTADYDNDTEYVQVVPMENYTVNQLGITLDIEEHDGRERFVIQDIEAGSGMNNAIVRGVSEDKKSYIDTPFDVKKGFYVESIGTTKLEGLTVEEANNVINDASASIMRVKVVKPGGGIIPMLVTTLYMIMLSLVVAGPIGIFAAIYLVEYAKPGRLVRLIRFGTESLAGIPSIIYGLFGMLFFVNFLHFGYSLLSGAMTVSIILLPVIIRQTEESLKAVPMSYREGSLGLGVTKIQTIRKVVLPSAVPGIVVAVILSVGRIVGESAAIFLTAGTAARIPGSFFESGATLTVKAYTVAKEEGNIEMACAIGTVIVVLVIVINFSSKFISTRFMNKN